MSVLTVFTVDFSARADLQMQKATQNQQGIRVLVLMSMRAPAHWEILRGINAFALDRQLLWTVRISAGRSALTDTQLESIAPNIILTQSEQVLGGAISKNMAVVAISPNLERVSAWSCFHDELVVGRIAAEYFLERGFRRFAYATPVLQGTPNRVSLDREEGFASTLKAHGHDPTLIADANLLGPTSMKEARVASRAVKSIAAVSEPTAIFCYNDSVAYSLIDCCRRQGISVPSHVAVLGVDDNVPICEAMTPPISSITLNHYRHGYRAAQMGYELHTGRQPETDSIILLPGSIRERASSDALMIEDPAVAKALHCLREHPSGAVKVRDMIRASGISRTLFETRFKRAIGHAPLHEIHRQRIRDIRHELVESSRSIAEIADRLGFSDPFQLHKLFKKLTGLTPSAYRKQHRGDSKPVRHG